MYNFVLQTSLHFIYLIPFCKTKNRLFFLSFLHFLGTSIKYVHWNKPTISPPPSLVHIFTKNLKPFKTFDLTPLPFLSYFMYTSILISCFSRFHIPPLYSVFEFYLYLMKILTLFSQYFILCRFAPQAWYVLLCLFLLVWSFLFYLLLFLFSRPYIYIYTTSLCLNWFPVVVAYIFT